MEVGDTTAGWDRTVKVPLYGRAGVVEVWLVDIGAETVEVSTGLGPEGYVETRRVGPGDAVEVAGARIGVDEILG